MKGWTGYEGSVNYKGRDYTNSEERRRKKDEKYLLGLKDIYENLPEEAKIDLVEKIFKK